jgi:hypothetical protein
MVKSRRKQGASENLFGCGMVPCFSSGYIGFYMKSLLVRVLSYEKKRTAKEKSGKNETTTFNKIFKKKDQ